MSQTGQMGSHIECEYNSFIKRVNHVNPYMIQTRLASTHNLFINRLVVLGLWVVSNFVIPSVDKLGSAGRKEKF